MLVPGQHLHRLGWHHWSGREHADRAFKPRSAGVLTNRYASTNAAVSHRLNTHLDHSINVHWSGCGGSNRSAGCQVISGHWSLWRSLAWQWLQWIGPWVCTVWHQHDVQIELVVG